MSLFKLFNRWLCNRYGHKEGWYPFPPWWCERCGADFKKEWDVSYKEAYYQNQAMMAEWDKEKSC